MAICYLCGLEMITKEDYKPTADSHIVPKFRHDEHILQNALYGRLKSNNILCETCGSELSRTVDSEFVKIFDVFTDPISHMLARDRGGKIKKSLRGHIIKHDGSKIEIKMRDGKVLTLTPAYDYNPETQTVKIFAELKTQKNYSKLVEKELTEQGIDMSAINIELIDDITDYHEIAINFSEGLGNFNEIFKLGLNKIATGFAAENGVERQNMPCTLDVKKQAIIFTDNIVPFFPIGALDYVIEPFRIALENEFPTHTLLLYTDHSFDQTKLVCYIDLFSTFQYYVILNHEYIGASINKIYYQTIIRQEKADMDVRATRWKYLPLLADELGVPWKEIQDLSIAQMYDFLEKKHTQATANYNLNFSDYLKHIASRASMNLLLNETGIMQLSEIERDILSNVPKFETNELLSMHYEMKRIENDDPQTFYRQSYFDSDKDHITLESTLAALIACTNNTEFNGFKNYGHVKFALLSHFIQLNRINQ